ncbi:MAG: PA2779 family protein [Thermodesulfovibrionales bacterium]|nr:PA2779 family protein [Thermodesulfovibrionales bacterium]
MKFPFMKSISWYLIIIMFLIAIAPRTEAGFIASDFITSTMYDRGKDLDTIQKILETKAIKQKLENLGFTQEEINKRLSQLDDQQIHHLALKLDELQVGGDGLGVVIALLVIAILVVILLQLTGRRIIVTK